MKTLNFKTEQECEAAVLELEAKGEQFTVTGRREIVIHDKRYDFVIIVGAGYAIKYNCITKAEAIIAFEDACKTYANMEVSIYQSTNLYSE